MIALIADLAARRSTEMYFATVVACGLITFHSLPDGWPFLVRLAMMVAAQYGVGRDWTGKLAMAYDELQRDPPQLMADFIEHTRDACWDLQFYLEWRLNQGLESEPVISAFTNVLAAFRQLIRAGVAPDGELVAQPEPLMARRVGELVAALSEMDD